MRKSLIVLGMSALVALTSLSGCKKYEDGPRISFRSPEHRVENTWKVEKLLVNGVDMTPTMPSDYIETYTKDGVYGYSSADKNVGSGSGIWVFQNDKKEIKRSGVSGQSTVVMYILKLKENHFWYYYMDGSDKYEFHLVSE